MSIDLSFERPLTRRQALCRVGNGFGMMAFAGMVAGSLARAGATTNEDGSIAMPKPHHEPKARRVIFLYMNGGLSQVDSFDHKPALEEISWPAASGRLGGDGA